MREVLDAPIPERHFQSELGILPILVRMLSFAAAQDQNVRFQKPAQNEHFYRLSCRAEKPSRGIRTNHGPITRKTDEGVPIQT
jgi:hypothetical protein